MHETLVQLSRLQFALTIAFHYLYPPLSIGLGVFLVCAEAIYLKTRDPLWRQVARFWTRVFALTFSIGVATGLVMEFEFGTNWAAYSRFVGDVFGSALAAEGIFAFFLESGFLALLLFGWDALPPRTHFVSTLMVALGAHFSAVWIVVANSWMQTPAGYHIVQGPNGPRAEITDFWALVFNPSSVTRLEHVLLGAWMAGAFLVMSVAAWYLLKDRHQRFAARLGARRRGDRARRQRAAGGRRARERAVRREISADEIRGDGRPLRRQGRRTSRQWAGWTSRAARCAGRGCPARAAICCTATGPSPCPG